MTADGLRAALRCGRPGCPCGRPDGNVHCPAHDDQNPSLSVRRDADGLTVIKCFAGCSRDAVLAALGHQGLWPERSRNGAGTGRPRETRYSVRDGDGRLVAVHIRRDGPDGKRLHWEQPDGTLGLNGLRVTCLPLYRSEFLPALPDGAVVVVTEGERAADAAARLGLPAVGTVTGAAAVPDVDALRPLARLQPVLWPDGDEPGRRHMERVAAALAGLGAEVRILTWPEAPEGGDAADLLETEGEAAPARLQALLAAAEPYRPAGVPDGARILDGVAAFIRRFVVLQPEQAAALALWALHTHAFAAADTTPYVHVTSAEKRSGKTRLLEVLSLLVANPWLTGRVSAAVLVRKTADECPTLLLDESDAAFKGDREYAEALRGILNAGFRRGGVASLCVGQGASIGYRDFPVYSPKAIAGIGKLPDTVADRSIAIELRRRAPGEPVERFRLRKVEPEAAPLREAAAAWAMFHGGRLADLVPGLPEALDDRAQDIWEPLLAIADVAGGAWPERARRAALALSTGDGREDGESLGVRLLRDLRAIFGERGADRLSTSDLLEALLDLEDAPWGNLRGEPLDARALARLLRPYRIRPDKWRAGDRIIRGYRAADLADAWSRYTPEQAPQAPQPPQPSSDAGSGVADTRGVADSLPATEPPPAAVHPRGVDGVADTVSATAVASATTNPHEMGIVADVADVALHRGTEVEPDGHVLSREADRRRFSRSFPATCPGCGGPCTLAERDEGRCGACPQAEGDVGGGSPGVATMRSAR